MADSVLGAVAGAIPVVGGVVDTLINNSNTQANNQATQAFDLQMQQQQETYNTQMWNMQNAYNSPSAQIQRLQAAGLNPALIYGGTGVTGNLASAPAQAPVVEYKPAQRPDTNFASSAAAAVAAYNNTKLVTAQSDNLGANAIDEKAAADLKQMQTVLTQIQADKTQAEIPLTNAQTDDAKADVILKQANAANLDADTVKKQQDVAVTNLLLPGQQTAQTLSNMKTAQDINLDAVKNLRDAAANSSSIKEAATRMILNNAMTAKTDAERQSILEGVKKIQESTLGDKLDNQLKLNGVRPGDNVFYRTLGLFLQYVAPLNFANLFPKKQDNGALQFVPLTHNSFIPKR